METPPLPRPPGGRRPRRAGSRTGRGPARLLAALLAAWLGAAAPAGAEPGNAPEAAAPADGAGSCLEGAVAAVQRRYEDVRDLSARFEQTTRPASLAGQPQEPETSSGRVVLAKPGKMRWVYEEPKKSLVVSDGKTLWLYDPEFGEAQRLPMTQGYLSGAAAQFLLGAGDLRRDFDVSAVECGPDAARLELVPREPATYEKIFLLVDPRTGDVRRTRIVDLLGNVSVVAFHDVKRNTDPAPGTFRFEPPKGVKVIDVER